MEQKSNIVDLPSTRRNAELDELGREHFEAKQVAALARQRLIDVENRILVTVGSKIEGSQTTCSGAFKITTTGKVNRKLDAEDVKTLYFEQVIPEAIYNRLFSWLPKLNITELRFIENNEPEIFRILEGVMTTSPAKTSVSVTPIAPGGAS